MLEKLEALLGIPHSDNISTMYYPIPDGKLGAVLDILGLTEDDLDTGGGTAETLLIETRGGSKFIRIVGSPKVGTGHAPVWIATKEEIPL